ncbi:hypothetical protein AYX13_06985 [Cryptococcus neoformans]|nr:hypothetical protein AYX13_06985 [Cryptococcus neoformans var. grubii]
MLEILQSLEAIDCPTIRVVCYGQKRRITDYSVPSEPAQPEHYKANTNLWDIGVNVHSDKIFLFRPEHGRSSGADIYSMVIPLSSDFGSCHIRLRYDSTDYEVKIYPLLVHKLKSFGGINVSDFKVHGTLKSRFKQYKQILNDLEKVTPSKLGGYRIEVTLHARTLLEARRMVEHTRFLDLNSWLYPTRPQLSQFKLDIKAITKEQYLQNAKAMRAAAESLPIWKGDNNRPVSKQKKKLLIDLAAAFGWCPSGFHATRSTAPYAWWNIWTEGIEPWQLDPVLDHLNLRWSTFQAVDRLTNVIRTHLPENKIPCQKGPIADGHCYHKCSTKKSKRFRLRCCLSSCRHSLNAVQTREWYATLMHERGIPWQTVGLQPAAEAEPAAEAASNESAPPEPAPSPTTPENSHNSVTPHDSLFDHINRRWPTPQAMWDLLATAFKEAGVKIPCPIGDFNEGHELRNAGGKTRFRLRCKHRKCTTSMELVASQSWIANLIEEGNLCRSLVGLPPDEARVGPERPSTGVAHGEPSIAPPILLPSHSISPLPAPSVPQSDHPSALPPSALPTIPRYKQMFNQPANGQCTWLNTIPHMARTHWTASDGHCLYRSFLMAYMGHATDEDVWQLRRRVADKMRQPEARAILAVSYNQCWMSESLNTMHGYVSDYDQYLDKVESDETMWGDQFTLCALEMLFGHPIAVLKKDERSDRYGWIRMSDSDKEYICLSLEGQHYENLWWDE